MFENYLRSFLKGQLIKWFYSYSAGKGERVVLDSVAITRSLIWGEGGEYLFIRVLSQRVSFQIKLKFFNFKRSSKT